MDDAAREYEDVEYGVVMLDTLPREKDNTKRVSNAASATPPASHASTIEPEAPGPWHGPAGAAAAA